MAFSPLDDKLCIPACEATDTQSSHCESFGMDLNAGHIQSPECLALDRFNYLINYVIQNSGFSI